MELPDYETLLARCLAAVPEGMDKREGSLIHMAMAPVCLRLAEAYAALAGYYDLVFSDTAAGEYLDRLTGQYGVLRKPASSALRKGIFKTQDGGPMDLSPGSRFYLDKLFFIVEERRAAGEYALRCETPGTAGNRSFGELLPAEYLQNFGSAELAEVLIPGEEEEGDDSLRERIAERLSAPAFGGNIADYREKVKGIPGVGAVKITPAASGGGTVRLTILDSRCLPPDDTLLEVVRETICGGGNGLGLAPIGHTVEVRGADGPKIPVTAMIVREKNAGEERVLAAVLDAVEGYFRQLREGWGDRDTTIIISALTSRMMAAEGVTDVRNIKVANGIYNLQVDKYAVPVFDREASQFTVVTL